MRLSDRITGITGGRPDDWALFTRARAMKAAGLPVTQLTIGEHDIRTDPRIIDAMAAAAHAGQTGYSAMQGSAALREKLAARVAAQSGVETGPENVLITPGGQAALFAAHMACLDPGDTGLFIDPYYATYPGTIRGASGLPVAVPTRAEDGFQPRARDIAARARGARSLLINTPNNPTGAVYSRPTLEEIATVCRDHGLWLISDEVYDTQVWNGAHHSPRALPGMADRTLVVGSMSKGHAMTGSRIGWLVAPEHVIAHILGLSLHTTYGVAGFVQEAALFALNLGPGFEAEIAAPFRRRREITARVLAAQNVVRMHPAQGAMYVMLDIRATGLSGTEFATALLETHQVATMPGESFGAAASGHLRVAMTVEDTAYEAALTTLCEFAGELANG